MNNSTKTKSWKFSHTIGRRTHEHNDSKLGKTGGFALPMDIALDNENLIYILNRGFGYSVEGFDGDVGNRIGKTTIDENHLGDFARYTMTWPNSLAISVNGDIYCSDEYENAIYVFDSDQVYPFPTADPKNEVKLKWGEKGNQPGKFKGPTGLTFDNNGDLHVVDSGNDRIQIFSPTGSYIRSWGESGKKQGQFCNPWGIFIDDEGKIYVADWGNNRVQIFDNKGQYISTIGTTGAEHQLLNHPSHVAVDKDGDIYVSDWGNNRVQIFNRDGNFIQNLNGDSTDFSKAALYVLDRSALANTIAEDTLKKKPNLMEQFKEFGRPTGIAISQENQVIIADSKSRLQVYNKIVDY